MKSRKKFPEKVLLEEGLKIRGKTEILKEKKNEILTKIPELLKKQEKNEIQLKTEIPQNNKKTEQRTCIEKSLSSRCSSRPCPLKPKPTRSSLPG